MCVYIMLEQWRATSSVCVYYAGTGKGYIKCVCILCLSSGGLHQVCVYIMLEQWRATSSVCVYYA